MASKSICRIKSCITDLEFLSSIRIKSPVVVEDIDKWKVVTDSNLVVISIMGGGNLHSSGTELHVDDDRVRDDWDSAINERVGSEFSVKMLQLVRTGDAQMGFGDLQCT